MDATARTSERLSEGLLSLRGELYQMGEWVIGADWRKRLRAIEATPPETMARDALSALLDHARTHVPYYRDLELSELRLDAFPILSRELLRTQSRQLASDDLSNRRWSKMTTGGSTGEPVWFIRDHSFNQWDKATGMRLMSEFCGISPRDFLRSRRVTIWHQRRTHTDSRLIPRMIAKLLGQVIRIEPYEILSEAKLTEFAHRINYHKPDVITAFAGMVYEIAKHAKRHGFRMHSPRFIMTSVEMLYPAMRETLEEVFRCPVRNIYTAAEVGRVACTCSEGNWHVLMNHNHVEILNPDDTPAEPGQMGRIVVTSLHNYAMPFIRYDIGDLARVSTKGCSCGSPLPTLDDVCGRVIHHFVRADGTLVFGGNFIAMFYEHEWMMQFHILQEDVNRITISYKQLPGSQIPEGAIEALTQTVQDVMGANCRVVWKEVDVIPNSPIGKHLHARSLVWEDRVQSGKK